VPALIRIRVSERQHRPRCDQRAKLTRSGAYQAASCSVPLDDVCTVQSVFHELLRHRWQTLSGAQQIQGANYRPWCRTLLSFRNSPASRTTLVVPSPTCERELKQLASRTRRFFTGLGAHLRILRLGDINECACKQCRGPLSANRG
jgi:hypothetical protein